MILFMNTCNKIENDSCQGCSVPAILWRQIHPDNRDQIDSIAAGISKQYCPDESGGIDQPTKAVIYNHNAALITPSSIW